MLAAQQFADKEQGFISQMTINSDEIAIKIRREHLENAMAFVFQSISNGYTCKYQQFSQSHGSPQAVLEYDKEATIADNVRL